MKKLTAITLATLISIPSFAGVASANSIKRYPGQREYIEKYRNTDFRDIRGHWSEEAVYTIGSLGIVKGVGNGNYSPQGTLTKEQTLILLVRLLGREEEAQQLGITMSENRDTGGQYELSNYHYSVKGAVSLAESMGILTPEDMANINPITEAERASIDRQVGEEVDRYRGRGLTPDQLQNIGDLAREKIERRYTWQRPAPRELVAYWLGRAISEGSGITGDSQQAISTFTDWESINGRYSPYIEEVLQKGLMVGGTGNRFYPKSNITRAEMAQIIYNAHEEQLEGQDYLLETGEIVDISIERAYDNGEYVRRRVIKVQTEQNDIIEIYAQDSLSGDPKNQRGIVSYVDGVLRNQQSLREGQYIRYYIKPSGEVPFISTLSDQPETINGRVLGVYDEMILVEDNLGDVHRYKLSERVDFKVNGVWKDIEDLIPQMSGRFSILNGNIRNIDISLQEGGIGGGGNISVGDYFHTGSVVSSSSGSLTISRDDGSQNISTYDLSSYPNIPIYRDDIRIGLSSVRAGDIATVYFSNLEGEIDHIKLQSFKSRDVENIYKGNIGYYNRNRNQIRLIDSSNLDSNSNWKASGETKILQVDENADLYVTDESGTTDILISRSTFEDYNTYNLQKAEYIEYALNNNQDLYLYTEQSGSGEVITRIVLRGLGEYKFSGLVENTSRGTISIPSNKNIYYNNSTIVLKEGKLVEPLSISEGDTITVYTHDGRNTAGLIVVEGRSTEDYPNTVYSTRLSGVNLTRQTLEISGTGSDKVSGIPIFPLPIESLNITTDTVVEHMLSATETETISAQNFLDRYYRDFEYADVKLVTDTSDNILKMQIYGDTLSRPKLEDIRTAVVKSKDLATGRVEFENIRTWTGSSWSSGVDQLTLDLSRAIVISNDRPIGLDRLMEGSRVDIVGDVNTGHTLIIR